MCERVGRSTSSVDGRRVGRWLATTRLRQSKERSVPDSAFKQHAMSAYAHGSSHASWHRTLWRCARLCARLWCARGSELGSIQNSRQGGMGTG